MPNISIAELNRLKEIESHVRESSELKFVEPFTADFIENVGIMLAAMPRVQWPSWVETAFDAAAKKHPHGARIYTEWHKR